VKRPAGSKYRLKRALVVFLLVLVSTLQGISPAADRNPAGLFVSAESVLQSLSSSPSTTLVDIRSRDDFQRCRIPGSINIPLSFVKTKAFLKNRRLVLVSRGYGQRFMAAECRRLKAGGFRAAILLGGLCAWQQAGGELAGDLTVLGLPATITPRHFFQEKNAPYWLIVDTSPPSEESPPMPFTSAVRIVPTDRAETVLQKLRQAARDRGNDSLLTVLAACSAGETDTRMQKILTKDRSIPVVFLEGGLRNYRAFLTRRNLAIQAGQHRVKAAPGCLPCGNSR
jgi:rhodanese-related sulfurtransferase